MTTTLGRVEAAPQAPLPVAAPSRVLAQPQWTHRSFAHQRRVDGWLAGHLRRRRTGEKHPVEDFLFSYYSFRPAALRRWHPGAGTVLLGDTPLRGGKGYTEVRGPFGTGVAVDAGFVAEHRELLRRTRRLLVATRDRPPSFGCLGLHEWAMVFRQSPEQLRHAAWPLRLGGAGTDAVVQRHRIRCSHFDAYRFFTDAARPLNALRPGSDDREEFEQPGCLHAGMDLYKHAFRLTPMLPAELVADCFELARDIRVLDMRASPYDLSGLGYEPVRIETAQGKQQYASAQRRFSERAAPLRQRLIDACDGLLG